jgi:hypothetical protein
MQKRLEAIEAIQISFIAFMAYRVLRGSCAASPSQM